jgi:hypothetical protein
LADVTGRRRLRLAAFVDVAAAPSLSLEAAAAAVGAAEVAAAAFTLDDDRVNGSGNGSEVTLEDSGGAMFDLFPVAVVVVVVVVVHSIASPSVRRQTVKPMLLYNVDGRAERRSSRNQQSSP